MSSVPEKRIPGGTVVGLVSEPAKEPEAKAEKPKRTAKPKTKGEG